MLKKSITYHDFNDREVTEEFRFHLSVAELFELEAAQEGGMAAYLQHTINSGNNSELLKIFKQLVVDSIGRVSEDGKRFVKNDEIRNEFLESGAYSAMLLELASNSDAAAEFVNGIMPSDLERQVAKLGENANSDQPRRAHPSDPAAKTPLEVSGHSKVLTRDRAETMSREDLLAYIRDGWTISD